MDESYKAMFALSIIGAVAGFAFLVAIFVALTRNPKHRPPFLGLAASVLFSSVCRLLRAAHTLSSYENLEGEIKPSEFPILAAWTFTDAFAWLGVFAATLLVLRDRAAGLVRRRLFMLNPVISIGLLFLLAASALGTAVGISFFQDERSRLVAHIFSFMYLGFFLALVVDIFSTAFAVRSVVTNSFSGRDKPTRAIVVGLLPLMVLQLIWVFVRLFIWYTPPLVVEFPAFVDEIVAVSLYPGIVLTILIPGLHPTWWQTERLPAHRDTRLQIPETSTDGF